MNNTDKIKTLVKNVGDGKNTTKYLGILFGMSEDPANREEIIILNGIPVLVNALKDDDLNSINKACGALGNLCNLEEAREEIVEVKGVERIIRLFKQEDDELNEALCHVWVNLSKSANARKIFIKKNAVKYLLPLVISKNKKIVKLTLQALVTLFEEEEICEQVKESEDGFHDILTSLKSKEEEILRFATGCIWNICQHGKSYKKILKKEKVKSKLLNIFKNAISTGLLINCAMAISLLENEEFDSDDSQTLSVIVNLLSNDDTQIVNIALGAIWNLGHQKSNIETMRKAGLIKKLIEFLSSKDNDLVMKSLGCLVTYGKDEQFAQEFKDEKGVELLLPFLEKDYKKKQIHVYAVISVACLAYHEKVKFSILDNNIIEILIGLLSSKDKEIIQKSLSALLNMSTEARSRKEILDKKGIPILIDFLFNDNEEIQQNSAGILWNMSSDPDCQKMIRELDGLAALLSIISGEHVSPRNRSKSSAEEEEEEVLLTSEKIERKPKKVPEIKTSLKKSESDEEDNEESKIIPMSPRMASMEECSKKIIEFAKKLRDNEEFNKIFNEDEISDLKVLLKDSYNWTQENKYASKVEINDFNLELENKINNAIDKAKEKFESRNFLTDVKKELKNYEDYLSTDELNEFKKLIDEHSDVAEYSSYPDRIKKKRNQCLEKVQEMFNRSTTRKEFEDKLRNLKQNVKKNEQEFKNLSTEDQDIILEKIKNLRNWILENPSSEMIEQKQKEIDDLIQLKLKEPVNSSVDPINKTQARKKFENVTSQIYKELDSNVKLNNQSKENIRTILKNSENWLSSNPNASDKEILQYQNNLFKLLGPQSEYKFKVFASVNYGLGVAIGDDKKFGKYVNPNEEKPSCYYESYLGQWERNKKLKEEKLSKVTRNPMLSSSDSTSKKYPFESFYSSGSTGKYQGKSIEEIKSKMINPVFQSDPMSLTVNSKPGRQSVGYKSVLRQSAVGDPNQTFTYEQLQVSSGVSLPDGMDSSKREMYLSNEEFKKLFGMEKEEFSKLAEWRKKRLKQDLHLW
eukprot:gene12321-5995_t